MSFVFPESPPKPIHTHTGQKPRQYPVGYYVKPIYMQNKSKHDIYFRVCPVK